MSAALADVETTVSPFEVTIGHVQRFHGLRSEFPHYTWEQYAQQVCREQGRVYEVAEVSSLDDVEAWII